jgi:hypothetical protein
MWFVTPNSTLIVPNVFVALLTFICLSIHPSICLSFCPSVRPSVRPSIHLPTYLPTHPFIHPSIHGSTALCWALAASSVSWSFTQSVGLLGRGDQPVAKALPTHRTTQTQNKGTQTFMPRVGFEPTIPVFERVKTVHALDRAATLFGVLNNIAPLRELIDAIFNLHIAMCSIFAFLRANKSHFRIQPRKSGFSAYFQRFCQTTPTVMAQGIYKPVKSTHNSPTRQERKACTSSQCWERNIGYHFVLMWYQWYASIIIAVSFIVLPVNLENNTVLRLVSDEVFLTTRRHNKFVELRA